MPPALPPGMSRPKGPILRSMPSTALATALLLVSLLATSGRVAADETTAQSAHDGSGQSYWGAIPARVDTVEAQVEPDPRPLWEYPILVPYRIVEFPLKATEVAMGAAYRGLEHSGAIYHISKLLAPKQVPYGFLLNVGGGSLIGAGTGLTLYHDEFLGPHNRLRMRTALTTKGTQKATLGGVFGEGQATEIEVGLGYRVRENARYFGTGSEAPEYQKSYYSQDTSWGGIHATRLLTGPIHFGVGAIYSGIGARLPGEDHNPSVADEFSVTPKGYRDLSTGITFSASLIRDTTEDTGRPESGTIQRLRTTYFTGTGDESRVDFWSYRADVETFIPLWLTERALAVRGYVNWLDENPRNIPFQRLLTNDEPDLFRGYRDYRWRDRGIAAVSMEYRWPLWANKELGGIGVDTYIFSDVGQVFHEFRRIAANNLTVSYGGGVRAIGGRGFGSRVEIAISEEETVFRVSSDQIFQYAKGGLLHGRDQAALR